MNDLLFFDTHTHLNLEAFKDDWKDVAKEALAESVYLINVGTSISSSKKALEIASHFSKGVFAAIGIHPIYADKNNINLQEFNLLLKNKKAIAIGEIGLDFSKKTDLEKQKEIFEKQLELAQENKKPVIIHCRDSHQEVIKILKKYQLSGVRHFFTGSIDEAFEYLDLGFFISFSGLITLTDQFDKVIKKLPLSKILIETDAPFVSPLSFKGKRNKPIYVKEVAKKIAKIKQLPLAEVAKKTTQNAKLLFNI